MFSLRETLVVNNQNIINGTDELFLITQINSGLSAAGFLTCLNGNQTIKATQQSVQYFNDASFIYNQILCSYAVLFTQTILNYFIR